MLIDVSETRYVRDFVVWLRFEDGSEGEIDLSGELYGPVFEPLKDQEYFKQVKVDPELGTIAWPNGADFAPEFLYEELTLTHSAGTKSAVQRLGVVVLGFACYWVAYQFGVE